MIRKREVMAERPGIKAKPGTRNGREVEGQKRGRSGFTLVEILVPMAIAAMLMAALYQAMQSHARYSETASERLREPQIARVLLHQIADELRSIAPPLDPWQNPERSRRLLGFGDVDFSNPDAIAAGPRELGEGELPQRDPGARVGNVAERFALLGTSNRLLMLVRRSPMEESSVERYERTRSETGAAIGSEEEKHRSPARWGDIRQVFYLPRPLPDVLERAKKNSIEVAEADRPATTGSAEEEIHPYFGGVVRQEVLLPFSIEAQDEAFFQLVPQLFAESEDAEPLIKPEGGPSRRVAGEKPLPLRTTTRVLSDKVTAIRFRYHDGWNWVDRWDRHESPPRAVEISISFDPRASDPEYLAKHFEEEKKARDQGIEGQGSVDRTAAQAGGAIEKPLFPYRLVVSIPTADHTPVRRFEGVDEGETAQFVPAGSEAPR